MSADEKELSPLAEAFGKEMEESMFRSLKSLAVHTDDPFILAEWFNSGGPWPEHVQKRFMDFLMKLKEDPRRYLDRSFLEKYYPHLLPGPEPEYDE